MVEMVVWEKERCVVVKADVVKSNSAFARAHNPGLDLRRGGCEKRKCTALAN